MKNLKFILLSVVFAFMSGTLAAQTKLEAENAQRSHCDVVSDGKYSGGKAVRMTEENARLNFSFNVENGGKYTVYVAGNGIGGEKVVNCQVNGTGATFRLNNYGEVEVGIFFVRQGSNTLTITPSWTWYDIDYVRIQGNDGSLDFDISPTPVDDDATEEARLMYTFLRDNFGKRTISGIMTGDMTTANGNVTQHADVKAVFQMSGKYPALLGWRILWHTCGMNAITAKIPLSLTTTVWKRSGCL